MPEKWLALRHHAASGESRKMNDMHRFSWKNAVGGASAFLVALAAGESVSQRERGFRSIAGGDRVGRRMA